MPTTRRFQLQEGKSDRKEVFKAINYLFRVEPPPGIAFFPSLETVPAFKCVGTDAESDGVQFARADGSVYAVGVTMLDVLAGGVAKVRTLGVIEGAVSGRVANDAVFVGPDGSLVFAAPGVGNYVQPIAVCVNATDIYVNPGNPVI